MKWQKMIPILLSACLSIAGCKEVKDPEFRRIDNFGVRSISLQDATIGFDVTYFNPNNFGVNVKEAAADVYIDSLYLGKFTQVQSVNVRQEADFSIPFSGKVSFQTALNLNFDSITRKDVLLRAEGSAKIGKAGVYVNKPIHYQGRHRLDEIKLTIKKPL